MNGFEDNMSYKPRIIQAHANELAAMALSPIGNLLATASTRVYNSNKKKKDFLIYSFFLNRVLLYVYFQQQDYVKNFLNFVVVRIQLIFIVFHLVLIQVY